MDVLQFLGTIGIITLGTICLMLSLDKNKHLILISGQSIFKWMSLTLITVAISRTLSFVNILPSVISRNVNSIVFLVSVVGIVWSVASHVRSKTN